MATTKFTWWCNAYDVGNDTRRFTTSRLASTHGYDSDSYCPVVHDGLDKTFNLRRCTVWPWTGRDVQVHSRRYEIWSPNSRQKPYYPGLSTTISPAVKHVPLIHRRVDGRASGVFDYTIVPQYYDKRHPWRAFIVRPGKSNHDEYEHKELPDVWECDAYPAKHSGRITSSFLAVLEERNAKLDRTMEKLKATASEVELWNYRPRQPQAKDFKRMSLFKLYDDAVDGYVEVQTGIKEKAAWIAMVQTRLHTYGAQAIVPAANDALLGVWINNISKSRITWLLHVGVPCFVIHEYQPGIDYPTVVNPSILDTRRDTAMPDFLAGSDTKTTLQGSLLSRLAVKLYLPITSLASTSILPKSDATRPKLSAADKNWSASRVQELIHSSRFAVALPSVINIASATEVLEPPSRHRKAAGSTRSSTILAAATSQVACRRASGWQDSYQSQTPPTSSIILGRCSPQSPPFRSHHGFISSIQGPPSAPAYMRHVQPQAMSLDIPRASIQTSSHAKEDDVGSEEEDEDDDDADQGRHQPRPFTYIPDTNPDPNFRPPENETKEERFWRRHKEYIQYMIKRGVKGWIGFLDVFDHINGVFVQPSPPKKMRKKSKGLNKKRYHPYQQHLVQDEIPITVPSVLKSHSTDPFSQTRALVASIVSAQVRVAAAPILKPTPRPPPVVYKPALPNSASTQRVTECPSMPQCELGLTTSDDLTFLRLTGFLNIQSLYASLRSYFNNSPSDTDGLPNAKVCMHVMYHSAHKIAYIAMRGSEYFAHAEGMSPLSLCTIMGGKAEWKFIKSGKSAQGEVKVASRCWRFSVDRVAPAEVTQDDRMQVDEQDEVVIVVGDVSDQEEEHFEDMEEEQAMMPREEVNPEETVEEPVYTYEQEDNEEAHPYRDDEEIIGLSYSSEELWPEDQDEAITWTYFSDYETDSEGEPEDEVGAMQL